jgi:asparagine synthase (glutamine-hydrolysing)
MCSISGTIHFGNFAPLEAHEQTRRSLSNSKHRGPDHSAVVPLACGALGHNRLSIIDLSEAANQPFTDPTGRYFLVLNGEIFNYKELRNELSAKGIEFRTKSDTEVLLQMLIAYGEKALDKLNGFFAFAFFDSQKNNWIIARDRFGEKPLFFHKDENRLCFASELRALMQFDLPKQIDTTSLSLLLQLSYIPAPYTIISKVYKLMPGHVIVINEVEGKSIVEINKWYNAPKKEQAVHDKEQVIVKFRQLLDKAVERRLNSDVGVGCFLSGGVDSSIIALTAKKYALDLHTFSLGFKETAYLDETKYAQEVAKHIGTKHETFLVDTAAFTDEITNVLEAMDEPFGDSSAIAMWLLSKHAKQNIKVALSGDGADELLGGYNKHWALLKSSQKSIFNDFIPKLGPFTDLFPAGRNNPLSNTLRQIKRYNKGLEKTFRGRYIYWSSFAEGTYHEDLLKELNVADKGMRIISFVSDVRMSDINTVLLADQSLALANDMLVKVDTMSMAHALEVRPPFLDHTVVEYINSLDSSHKIKNGARKILLKECYQTDLPASVFNRPKKGFEIPLSKMLRNELKPLVLELLSESNMALSGLFKLDVVSEVLNDFYKLRRDTHTSLIYSLLVFQWWYKETFQKA